MQDILASVDKHQKEAEAAKSAAIIKANQATLFNSPHQVVLGNPHGTITAVEFFDYNCAYCKHALPDMMKLLQSEPNLRFVLKEFPVLGPGSVDAAHVAVAARMQDPTGAKYIEFHQKLLGGRGVADLSRALAVAKEVGFDMTRLQKDMSSPEVKTTIDEDMKLADAIGVDGTPSYVVGDQLVVGAVGFDELKQKLAALHK
jgi:protein-disulfide isomerase